MAGECASTCDVEIEEMHDMNLLDVIPEFIKTPLPAIALPGNTVSFCTRITPIDSEVVWSVCGITIDDDMKGYMVSYLAGMGDDAGEGRSRRRFYFN
jgi:hypothetical protein